MYKNQEVLRTERVFFRTVVGTLLLLIVYQEMVLHAISCRPRARVASSLIHFSFYWFNGAFGIKTCTFLLTFLTHFFYFKQFSKGVRISQKKSNAVYYAEINVCYTFHKVVKL